jgi:glucose-1-phosphate cytidylyltransferase
LRFRRPEVPSKRELEVKVVLFCGGLGLRMREASARIPKPMVPLGNRPVLWHVMKYFAHYGHTDFVLCLGHKAEVIKEYFLNYNEALSNDFVLSDGGREVELLRTDTRDWRITFVDTGLKAKVGERLKAVEQHLDGEEMFLANYGDVLTDAPLPDMIENLERRGKIGSVLCVRPNYTFHVVELDETEVVRGVQNVTTADLWINGGYFVFRHEIFDYIREGEDLVVEPFKRLIAEEQLVSYRYEGFWAPMDTLKDKNVLEALLESGAAPWRVWEKNGNHAEHLDVDALLAEAERLSE